MATLTDHVDRLSAIAMSIRAAAAPPPRSAIPGPFTRAILETPLGDLIRDIDPAEMGLFTLVQPQQPLVPEVEPTNVEIARVEFLGATPLRKPPSARHPRPDGQRPREHDPEVYANAALKYLDRYQSIRPMPRASEQAVQMLDRLEEVRANIHRLSEQLKQQPGTDPAEPPLSPKSAIKEEERQIQDIQSQIQYLKQRKEELAKKKSRTLLKVKREPKPQAPESPASPPDEREETFWNTPGAAARTLHFTGDSLLDEEIDINDVSAASFGTPVTKQKVPEKASLHDMGAHASHSDAQPGGPEQDQYAEDEEDEVESVLDEDDATEPTVVLQKVPSPPSPPQKPRSPEPEPVRKQERPPEPVSLTSGGHRPKVKVTTELERVVEKIWATVGEIIMPGNPFDALGKSTNKSKPPRAKETMAYLQELSNHTPTPASPSASSFSSLSGAAPSGPGAAPTAQQVLTAHMLLVLLGAPGFALTLRALKETLAEKAAAIGAGGGASAGLLGGSAVTKPVYGCVAKRLLKIERGAGEQVVKFDL
ncbi:hypothetical protein C8Q70DRAFT_969737 [Cubamyces menziesii]|uniref:Uncharacterized protein n=1 Tax=Trametes cubensis TaxID=1111947 RepID=A0AAD7XDQ5_9APHY|nr:hypothetical protein C8Q70DRAFT_969737 [Cubamyces menziesii]KAJ8497161.1 hypothetical protein ONZ51_g690 [Trametes cubensis]